MFEENDNFFDEIFELFVVSKTANGVTDSTLRNYHYHRKANKLADYAQGGLFSCR